MIKPIPVRTVIVAAMFRFEIDDQNRKFTVYLMNPETVHGISARESLLLEQSLDELRQLGYVDAHN